MSVEGWRQVSELDVFWDGALGLELPLAVPMALIPTNGEPLSIRGGGGFFEA